MQCHRAGAGHVDRLVELHRQAMDVGAINRTCKRGASKGKTGSTFDEQAKGARNALENESTPVRVGHRWRGRDVDVESR